MTTVVAPAVAAGFAPALTRQVRAPRAVRVALGVAVALLPLLRPETPGNTGPADAGLAVGIAVIVLWANRDRIPVRLPYFAPVALLITGGALAALAMQATGALTVVQDVYLYAWVAMVATACRDRVCRDTVLRCWAITGTCYAALMLIGVFAQIPALSGIRPSEGSRASFALGDPNVAANYFVVTLFLARAVRCPSRAFRRFCACAVLVTAVVFTGSNGGMLTLVVGTALGAALRIRRRSGAAAAVVIGLTAVVVAGLAASRIDVTSIVTRAQAGVPVLRDSIGRTEQSTSTRGTLVQESLGLWESDSLLGYGPSGTKHRLAADQSPYVKEAHDDYAAALTERGVLGGVGIALLTVAVLIRAARVALLPEGLPDDTVLRPELILSAVLAVVLAGAFYEVLHFRHVWGLYGVLAAYDEVSGQ